MTEKLKPCPCGRPIQELIITPGYSDKYSWVSGNCCGEWSIEFRTNYNKYESIELMELAADAWNAAPRAK